MKSFKWILSHAEAHAGKDIIQARLPQVERAETLRQLSDDRYLSTLSRRVFRAGLKHTLVDGKWPAFEQAFFGFDPLKVSLMSDEQLEALMQNKNLIRHWGKLKAVRHNAIMVRELGQDKGGFGVVIADWPEEEIVQLWLLLKKRGAQLGGQSASAFLRMVGKDTFRLTPDVVAALKAQGVIDKPPTAQRDLVRVQGAFNQWREESGWPLGHISQVLAFTVGW
ncbi:DNA-3-methyladenine glycosylase I [Motiliproteus sp. SC1-56]|uniref:DNA-3-methyladenine glycosylase I n=1 Tax=Motiliproteus sp. SC1-56 TaxID=2799565 RepID=UPI001A8F8B0F